MEWLGFDEMVRTLGLVLGALAAIALVVSPWTRTKWDDNIAAFLRKWADRLQAGKPIPLDETNPYKPGE